MKFLKEFYWSWMFHQDFLPHPTSVLSFLIVVVCLIWYIISPHTYLLWTIIITLLVNIIVIYYRFGNIIEYYVDELNKRPRK